MNRNLDSCYFRIKRYGKPQNICFSDLTYAEREEICEDKDAEWFKIVVYHLADCLKKIGDTFDVVAKKDLEEEEEDE